MASSTTMRPAGVPVPNKTKAGPLATFTDAPSMLVETLGGQCGGCSGDVVTAIWGLAPSARDRLGPVMAPNFLYPCPADGKGVTGGCMPGTLQYAGQYTPAIGACDEHCRDTIVRGAFSGLQPPLGARTIESFFNTATF